MAKAKQPAATSEKPPKGKGKPKVAGIGKDTTVTLTAGGKSTTTTIGDLERLAERVKASAPSTTSSSAPKLSINADRLLRVLRACTPFAASGKDAAEQLKALHFAADDGLELAVEASDGHCAARVEVECAYVTAPISFCVQSSYLSPVVKLLGRVGTKERSELDATITITKHSIQVGIQATHVLVPRLDEQLEFPELVRVMPSAMHAGRKTVPEWGVNPDYLAKVARGIGQLGSCVRLTAPETTSSGIRLALEAGEAPNFKAVFTVAPMQIEA